MTTPKVSTFRSGSSRFYLHPRTGDKVPGVTSVLNMLPKPFLKAGDVVELEIDGLGRQRQEFGSA